MCSGSVLLTIAPNGYKEQFEDYEKEFQGRRGTLVINVTNPTILFLTQIFNCTEKFFEQKRKKKTIEIVSDQNKLLIGNNLCIFYVLP